MNSQRLGSNFLRRLFLLKKDNFAVYSDVYSFEKYQMNLTFSLLDWIMNFGIGILELKTSELIIIFKTKWWLSRFMMTSHLGTKDTNLISNNLDSTYFEWNTDQWLDYVDKLI